MGAESFEEMEKLPALKPFDEGLIELMSALSDEIRHDALAKKNPVLQTYAFFIRRSNLIKQKEVFFADGRIGKGLSLHIAPSNVPINFAYSLCAGLMAGNPCIVRASSKDFEETRVICGLLKKLEASDDLTEKAKSTLKYISVISYPHDKDVTDALSAMVNIRVIWGGDNTVSEIRRSPVRPRCTEVCFADRYSLLVIEAAGLLNSIEDDSKTDTSEMIDKKLEDIAHSFYNDTYLYDQNACGSPRLIYWIGSDEEIERARDIFWNAVYTYVRDRYEIQPVIAVDKLTMADRVSIDIPGSKLAKRDDNMITRVEVSLDSLSERYESDDESKISLYDYETPGGFYVEVSSDSIQSLAPYIDEKVQTCTFINFFNKTTAETADYIQQFVIDNGLKGIDRIVPIGHSADFGFIWDGYNLIDTFTRSIYVGF